MKRDSIRRGGCAIDVYSLNTVIVGTGAAGYNAADSLYSLGQRDIAIVTQGVNRGTSRNAGSDKQTYYKLTAASGQKDSVADMARTYFAGGCMHGDIALIEAALSARCFFKLVDLGVDFPCDRYNQYVGYRTDHDACLRATSAGPLTSRQMTERLEENVQRKGIRVFDGFQVIAILTDGRGPHKKAIGLAALNQARLTEENRGLTLFNCTNVIYATGGPAGIYASSVYPASQVGMSGIAFEAGARGTNLTEWQYGIASTKFRWNLSGTYQQVIPRYISTDAQGGDEREFLDGRFDSPRAENEAIFLKGYQWPFDPRKVAAGGSSLIDLLVYHEIRQKGRRVFLDYTRDPACVCRDGRFDGSLLGREAGEYLTRSGALLGTPIARLTKMNAPAVELYRRHGIDLRREYLEIDVCAQHNNGGLGGNIWWESNLRHFFPVGEVNGNFGIYRPGGSALNSTQAGSLRAAQYIAHAYRDDPPPCEDFLTLASPKIDEIRRTAAHFLEHTGGESNVFLIRRQAQNRMSRYAAQIRSPQGIEKCLDACRADLRELDRRIRLASVRELPEAFVTRDILISQSVYLSAMQAYIRKGGESRGSYLICHPAAHPVDFPLAGEFPFALDDGALNGKIGETVLSRDPTPGCVSSWVDVRPIPSEDVWFENVWNAYRRGEIYR